MCWKHDLTANTTDNTTQYFWEIQGTGISPSVSTSTATPQLTISYTNSVDATIRIKSYNGSCGNSSDPSAYYIFKPKGNAELNMPFYFSSPPICNTGILTISNQPANTNLVWTSADPNKLSVNSNSGALTRNDYNYYGAVSITATVSNACGSNSQTSNVWVGAPALGDVRPLYGSAYGTTVCTGQYMDFVYTSDYLFPQQLSYSWDVTSGTLIQDGGSSATIYTPGAGQGVSFVTSITNVCGTRYRYKSFATASVVEGSIVLKMLVSYLFTRIHQKVISLLS